MKYQKTLRTLAVLICTLSFGLVAAEESTSAIAAPKCDLAQIEALCADSDDCVKVEKGAWDGGYNVTAPDKEAETKFMTEVIFKNCM